MREMETWGGRDREKKNGGEIQTERKRHRRREIEIDRGIERDVDANNLEFFVFY